MMNDADQHNHDSFTKFDEGEKGFLTRKELQSGLTESTFQEFDLSHIEVLYEEFDMDGNGKIDFPEFQTILKYLNVITKGSKQKKRMSLNVSDLSSSIAEFNLSADTFSSGAYGASYASDPSEATNMSTIIKSVVRSHGSNKTDLLKSIAKSLYPVRDILCIQDNFDVDTSTTESALHQSVQMNFDDLLGSFAEGDDDSDSDDDDDVNIMDPDFEAAFSASDMKCLALVSHNGMKKSMREFVVANRNLLKKFRLTGTNSTMTMLKDVFKDEPAGTVVYGPACASGPLGGDAELVGHMVTGKIGGVIFFQDPMTSHPHKADIDCLVRQSLVHNVVMVETPPAALMICECLRMALIGRGRPELIPSFFFSLQSPTVEDYKAGQKQAVATQIQLGREGK